MRTVGRAGSHILAMVVVDLRSHPRPHPLVPPPQRLGLRRVGRDRPLVDLVTKFRPRTVAQCARFAAVHLVGAMVFLQLFAPNLLQAATWGEKNQDGNILTGETSWQR